MSDFDFEIKANPSDANRAISGVESGLEGLKGKAKEAGSAMEEAAERANQIFEALEAIAGLHVFESLLDGYTEVGNRIRSVATDQANFNGIMDETYDIAQSTRTGWDDVAQTYQRLQNATKGLGLSQRDVLDLQRELAQATKLSGSSAQEAAMTQRELAHAFETGSLTMREWKVIQRDAPALVNELKEASGKTGAQLARMAHEGTLSAQELIKWFALAKDDIDAKFGRLVPTIADDLLMLKNAATKFFGEAGAGAGIMEALGNATKFLIDHFETIGKVALGVIEVLAGLFIISKIISLIQMLSAAIAANPLGALLLAITIGISLLRQFGDEIETGDTVMSKAGKTAVTVGDYFRALWQIIKELASAIGDFLAGAWHALTDAFSHGIDGAGMKLTLKNVLVFMASFVDVGIGLFKAFREDTLKLLGGIVVSLGEMIIDVVHTVAKALEVLINDMIDAFGKIFKKLIDFSGSTIGSLAGLNNLKGMADAMGGADAMVNNFKHVDLASWTNPLDGAWKATKEIAGNFGSIVAGEHAAKDAAASFADKLKDAAADQARQRKPGAASTIGTDRGAVDPLEPTDKQIKALEKLQNELRTLLEATNPQIKAQEELAHGQDILNQAIANGNPSLLKKIEQYGGANAIMGRFKERLEDQLEPMAAIIRKTTEHADAMTDDTETTTKNLAVQKAFDEFRKATGNSGSALSDAANLALIRANVEIATRREQLMKQEQTDTQAILGPQKQWIIQQEALNDLLSKGRINADQYNVEIDKQRAAYLEASGLARTFSGGLESAWLAIKADVSDVGASIKKTLVDAFNGVNNAIVQLVTTGKADWHAMVQSMLADLTLLILKQLEWKAIQGIGSAFGVTVPGNQYGGSMTVPGFATGGSFLVGGAGSTDSKLVAFRATPGERVTVQTPKQQAAGGGAQQPGSSFHAHMIVVANQEEAAIQAMSTPRGQQVSIQTLQRNSRSVSRFLR